VSRLLVVHDGKRERELQLVERLVVGRDPACDITVEDSLLSRRHAEFVATRDVVTVRDLGSRNGIFVNGTRAAERDLQPGDVVQIGSLRVRYVTDRLPSPPVSGPLDIEGTVVIPPPTRGADTASVVPSVQSPTIDEEAETRAFRAPAVLEQGRDATPVPVAPGADDATGFVPVPPVTGRPAAIRTGPDPIQSPPFAAKASSAAGADQRALTTFVFVQFAVLATVVFACTSVPLLMWRSPGPESQDPTLRLLLWPVVPLFVALVAAYLIANLVTRRFHDVLEGVRQDAPGRY
jgi:hypothetical protein